MFTGIVEATGRIAEIRVTAGGKNLRIEAPGVVTLLPLGGSIAVNGCCVTSTESDGRAFRCDLMRLTLDRTNLGGLEVGDIVNLERPLRLGDELGGHIVQGHVEGVATVVKVLDTVEDRRITLRLPPQLSKYVIQTGSIALDGVSMTAADIEGDVLTVGVIPHTWDATNFSRWRSGTRVNIETDLLAKHIEKLLASGAAPVGLRGASAVAKAGSDD
ncbi:riboflavin synthase [candidate division KSB1 bacterium]|nr:riboflavin synthase [candidate division KSB1 bacterium]